MRKLESGENRGNSHRIEAEIAMFLFHNQRIFVIIIIEILLLLLTDDNGQTTLTKLPTTGEFPAYSLHTPCQIQR